MTIAFPCESCGYRFEVDRSLAGKKGRCKSCGHVFVIPVPREPSSPPGKPALKTFGSDGAQAAPARPRDVAAKPAAARPKPAPTPAPAPYADVLSADDPYGVDDLPPRTRPAPSAAEDEEFSLPSRGSAPAAAAKPRAKKKKSRRSSDEPADLPAWAYLIPIALLSWFTASALFSFNGRMFQTLTLVRTAILVVGFLGTLVVGFMRVGASSLWMFVPIANLVFMYKNYATLRPWVNVYLSMILVSAVVGGVVGGTVATMSPEDQRRWLVSLAAANGASVGAPQSPFAGAPGPARPPGPEFRAEPTDPAPATAPFPAPAPAPAPGPAPSVAAPSPAPVPGPGPNFGPRRGVPRRRFGAPPAVAQGPGNPPQARRPFGDPESADEALDDLNSDDRGRRKRALNTLARMPADDAAGKRAVVARAIEPMLKDADGFTRSDAAKALAVWGGPENTPALVAALKDPEFGVRWAVLDTFKALHDPAAAPAVAEALVTDRPKAGAALRAMGSGAEPTLLPYLNHSDVFVRMEACKILQEIGTNACVPALYDLIRRNNNHGLDCMAANEALKRLDPDGGGYREYMKKARKRR